MRYFYEKESGTVLSESVLLNEFSMSEYAGDMSFDDFLSWMTAPWECLTEINSYADFLRERNG